MTPRAVVSVGALLAVLLMMAAELLLSVHNARVLRKRGATEPGDDIYRTLAWAYPGAFALMAVEGAFFGPAPGVATLAGGLLFGAAKVLKFSAISALGTRWTFRVLVLPESALVRRGPYAWMRHPNYVAIVGELAGIALLVGARLSGPLAIIAMALLLRRRVAVEERALGIR